MYETTVLSYGRYVTTDLTNHSYKTTDITNEWNNWFKSSNMYETTDMI